MEDETLVGLPVTHPISAREFTAEENIGERHSKSLGGIKWGVSNNFSIVLHERHFSSGISWTTGDTPGLVLMNSNEGRHWDAWRSCWYI